MIDINNEIKLAILAKDSVRLASLRAVKTAFMMASEKGAGDLTTEMQLKIIQKQVKQRQRCCCYLSRARSFRLSGR